jgi:molybdopterin/thiamine biosynthesis adenylyltransferase
VIVACVDNSHARNELNRFCLRYGIPLVDVGTTITRKPLQIDGHLTRFVPGSQCLQCAGHVTEALLAEEAEHDQQGKYGINSRRPQVVSFNGLLASAAVTEVIRIVTGFDDEVSSSREWHYDGVRGELRSLSLGDHRCQACVSYSLLGDAMPVPGRVSSYGRRRRDSRAVITSSMA